MPKVLSWINGKKLYLGAAAGALVLVCHKLGVPTPGIEVNDQEVTKNLWELFMVFAAGHKLQKLLDAVNK